MHVGPILFRVFEDLAKSLHLFTFSYMFLHPQHNLILTYSYISLHLLTASYIFLYLISIFYNIQQLFTSIIASPYSSLHLLTTPYISLHLLVVSKCKIEQTLCAIYTVSVRVNIHACQNWILPHAFFKKIHCKY